MKPEGLTRKKIKKTTPTLPKRDLKEELVVLVVLHEKAKAKVSSLERRISSTIEEMTK